MVSAATRAAVLSRSLHRACHLDRVTARTSAVPGRRIVQLARAFGSDGLVSSICEEEYASFSNVLLDRIVAKLACTK
jgi:hypothetical protein